MACDYFGPSPEIGLAALPLSLFCVQGALVALFAARRRVVVATLTAMGSVVLAGVLVDFFSFDKSAGSTFRGELGLIIIAVEMLPAVALAALSGWIVTWRQRARANASARSVRS